MKHLTKYTLFEGVSKKTKLFESTKDDIAEYVKDILTDISDDFSIDSYINKNTNEVFITVNPIKPDSTQYRNMPSGSYDYTPLVPSIKHVESYLKENGYINSEVSYCYRPQVRAKKIAIAGVSLPFRKTHTIDEFYKEVGDIYGTIFFTFMATDTYMKRLGFRDNRSVLPYDI